MNDFMGSSMKRRAFIGTMVSGLLAAPLAASGAASPA
jgi:hypothetical protein